MYVPPIDLCHARFNKTKYKNMFCFIYSDEGVTLETTATLHFTLCPLINKILFIVVNTTCLRP